MLLAVPAASDPQVVARQRQGGADECREEIDEAGEPAQPAACVYHIDGAAHACRLVGVGVGVGGGDLSRQGVEVVGVSGAQAAAAFGYYAGRAVRLPRGSGYV